MRGSLALAPWLLALAACAGSVAHHAAPSADAPAEVEPPAEVSPAPAGFEEPTTVAETERVTVETGAFDAPAGFTLSRAPDAVRLVSPESDLTVVLAEVEGEQAEEAIGVGWSRFFPGFALAVRSSSPGVPVDGWDEVLTIAYDVPASESRAVVAVGRRRGGRVAVALVDGTLAAFGRRGAQLNLVLESFRLPGIVRESFAGREPRRLEGDLVARFDDVVERALAARDVPGAAIAVVQGGEVVYARGFGVRRLGDPAPVTPRTLFMIGSVTKPLTSLLMARLVDRGRMEWTTPVRELLPGFGLGSAELAERAQMEHTVCACTGMPRRDLELIFVPGTPERWLEVLRESTPTTGFGEVFQYSNLMVAAGGFAAGRALLPRLGLDEAYRTAMRREVFAPLGMRRTTLRTAEAVRGEHASPHSYDLEQRLGPMALELEAGVESIGPAGAAWSSLEDMVRYAQLELRQGLLPDGRRFVSEEALLERRRPRARISETAYYGLGLLVREQLGLQVVEHGGNTLGFTAHLKVFPEQDMAIVMLSNAAGANRVFQIIERRLLELVFEGEPLAETQLATFVANVERATRETLERAELEPTEAASASLLGTFEHPTLGELVFERREGRLEARLGLMRSRVGTLRTGDERVWMLLDPPLAGLALLPPSEARGGALRLDYPQMPYDFVRRD